MTQPAIHELPLQPDSQLASRLTRDVLILACASDDAEQGELMKLARELRRLDRAGLDDDELTGIPYWRWSGLGHLPWMHPEPFHQLYEHREHTLWCQEGHGYLPWMHTDSTDRIDPCSIVEAHDGASWRRFLVFELIPLADQVGPIQRALPLRPGLLSAANRRIRVAVEAMAEREWVPATMWDLVPHLTLLRAGTLLRLPVSMAA